MEQDATTIIKNQLKVIPHELTANSVFERIHNSVAALEEIYSLTAEQSDALELEISLTFLGLELVSTLEKRIESELELSKETLSELLENLAGMVLDLETFKLLSDLEKGIIAIEGEETSEQQQAKDTSPTKTPIPTAGVSELTIEEKKAQATGKGVQLKNKKKEAVKKQAEHAAKGIRTMRDDVERLRGGENDTTATPNTPGSSFTKPFKGS